VKHTCWTFSNSNFVKGQEENLVKIRRRANVRYKPNEQEVRAASTDDPREPNASRLTLASPRPFFFFFNVPPFTLTSLPPTPRTQAPESGLMLEAMDKRSRLVEMHLRQELKVRPAGNFSPRRTEATRR
jgi:hypothetical protein